MAGGQDKLLYGLLGMAETFRTSSPPKVRLCLQCLEAVLSISPQNTRIEARARLQLGTILLGFTKNVDIARLHLEKVWEMCQTIPQSEDIKLEVIGALADLYQQLNEVELCREKLRSGLEITRNLPFYHCKFLFQLAQLYVNDRDFTTACQVLTDGAAVAQVANAFHCQALFLLSKGALLIIERKMREVHEILTSVSQLLDHLGGPPIRKEGLKVFFLVLQVCHFLMTGQVKSGRPCLKQLQTSIQLITQATELEELPTGADCFQWMSKDDMCILVYLVTVMHSMQAGHIDKAVKYTEKALIQIEKLKPTQHQNPLLYTFQLQLLEHSIMCKLVAGDKSAAIGEIYQCCHLCVSQPKLLSLHTAQIHTMLGLYAMSVNSMEAAEAQFNTALRIARESDLWLFVNLNLAIVYLRTGREQEFYGLLERINPERFPSNSHVLRASAFYVRGLQSFFQTRYNEAKKYLCETLRMANQEDLNRLTSCTLVLLGYIFLSIGNSAESINMVQPAMELACKIPDLNIQLWASALLKDLYRLTGDVSQEQKFIKFHESSAQLLVKDNFHATNRAEHNLIMWTEGPCPVHIHNVPNSIVPE